MYCNDTGETMIVHVPGMAVADAQDIGEAMSTVRGYGHGTGEIYIPLVNGFFDRVRLGLTKFRAKRKKTDIN